VTTRLGSRMRFLHTNNNNDSAEQGAHFAATTMMDHEAVRILEESPRDQYFFAFVISIAAGVLLYGCRYLWYVLMGYFSTALSSPGEPLVSLS
jgi:hypothetical protein